MLSELAAARRTAAELAASKSRIDEQLAEALRAIESGNPAPDLLALAEKSRGLAVTLRAIDVELRAAEQRAEASRIRAAATTAMEAGRAALRELAVIHKAVAAAATALGKYYEFVTEERAAYSQVANATNQVGLTAEMKTMHAQLSESPDPTATLMETHKPTTGEGWKMMIKIFPLVPKINREGK